MKSLIALVGVCLVLTVAGTAGATSLVFDRGLPVDNLNYGTTRSNVAWYDSDYATGWFTGDNFKIAGTGQTTINSLRVWVVGQSSCDNFTLWTGTGEVVSATRTSAIGDANLAFNEVTYAGGSGYVGNSGATLPIYQLTFENLDWTVDNGVLYKFGVSGKNSDNHFVIVDLSASNAALSGSPQEGADGAFYGFNNGALGYTWNTGTDGGWDKSSDINVQLFAAPVPEPITMAGLMMGIGGLVGYARRRARK
jgi:hypothetical protein